jgi:hypothetical protein
MSEHSPDVNSETPATTELETSSTNGIDFSAWEAMETVEPERSVAAELNRRSFDGIVVRLMLGAGDHLYVDVDDTKERRTFAVDVPEGADPNEYFNHPFTHTRRQGSTVLWASTVSSDKEAA